MDLSQASSICMYLSLLDTIAICSRLSRQIRTNTCQKLPSSRLASWSLTLCNSSASSGVCLGGRATPRYRQLLLHARVNTSRPSSLLED